MLYARMPRRREEAVKLLEKAVAIRLRQLGRESLYYAESLHELGSALLLRRKRTDAELALEHLSKAAKIREACLGKKTLPYAASLHQVGQAYMHLENYQESRLYLQAAVAIR